MANNIEWLNQNSLRSYPFREDTSLSNDSGAITLPNSLIVDFIMVAPAEIDLELQLKSVLFGADLLSMSFCDASGNLVTSVSVSLDDHNENDGYKLSGQGEYEDAVGRITVGNVSDLSSILPEGSYSFALGTALFEQSVVRPDIRGVRALRIRYADGSLSDPIYGRVDLVPGSNVQLTTSSDGNGIRIDSVATDLEEECDCEGEFLKPKPITSLAGIAPDETGNIDVIGVGSASVSGSQGRLVIEDHSSEPCCGCEELESIMDAMQLAYDTTGKLEELMERLNLSYQNLTENVLRSIV